MTTTDDDLAMPFLLMSAFRNLVDAVHDQVATRGFPDVRASHGFTLQAVGEGCTSVQLGERLGVSKQAATKSASTLVDMGLLERHPNEQDRRERVLRLTAKGRELLNVSAIAFREELGSWRARAGDAHVDATLQTLRLVGHGGRGDTDLSDWA